VNETLLFLGVDGGGTRCRARLCDAPGAILGEGAAGPANVRLGVDEAILQVLEASRQCLAPAMLSLDSDRIVACLALAGATEPTELEAARTYPYPFRHVIVTTDAHAACIGAHRGEDGGVIIVGTGTVAWAVHAGRHHRVGGWGFPLSDEGSGAWLGFELARRVFRACDGRVPWTGLLTAAFERFGGDPHAIVRWMGSARPRDFAELAPLVVHHASQGDPVGCELMQSAARHVDLLAERLCAIGVQRIALAGGLSPSLAPWLGPETKRRLVAAADDALAGALWLARAEAECSAPAF
jgi:glucosamine kinase